MPKTTAADTPEPSLHSQSFVVRLWCEDLGQGRKEWRGRVQNVSSGEVRCFRDWQTLVACIQDMLQGGQERA
jgi:hypothetical protein